MRRLKLLTLIAVLIASYNAKAQGVSLIEPASADYFFQGRYRVGSTTCTVKPIKMAFEVRWAKGKAPMIFFFDQETPQGEFVYASEDKGKGKDRFIFDNDRFETGKFIRSDGKEFAVKKIR